MDSMSTPLQQLPDAPVSSRDIVEEDPAVTDVIAEMQREMTADAAAPRPSPPQPVYRPRIDSTGARYIPREQPRGTWWWYPGAAQQAAVAAVIALVLLHTPFISGLYDRIPAMASQLLAYDRLIRVVLLALVLYVVFVRMDA